jgi:AcrR family transcriptional regulator
MPRANLTSIRVIEAAADLADSDGLEHVTLSAVARGFGVQTASLYSHVRDHAALLDGIHELALSELADRIGTATAGRSGQQALAALADAQRTYARRSPGRWDALQRPAAPSTVQSEAAARVATLMWATLREYALPESELVHATRFLGATINGFVALEKAGSFDHRSPAPEMSWWRTLEALDTVMRAWPIPPRAESPA